MSRRFALFLAVFAFALLTGCSGGRSNTTIPRYRVVDLPIPQGKDGARAAALNNMGQVAGVAWNDMSPYGYRVYLWESGAARDVGIPEDYWGNLPSGLDDTGRLLLQGVNRHIGHELVYENGVLRAPGAVLPALNSPHVRITAASDAGTPFLAEYLGADRRRVYVSTGSGAAAEITEITFDGGGNQRDVFLSAVSDTGVIGGQMKSADGTRIEAFLWQNGSLRMLRTLSGDASGVTDVNDRGEAVGAFNVRPVGAGTIQQSSAEFPNWWNAHAFVYRDGRMHDIGALPRTYLSVAAAINEAGQVVGTSSYPVYPTFNAAEEQGRGRQDEPEESINRAFLWEEGRLQDLNDLIADDSGWVLESATDINDRGEICGSGTYQGRKRAFLLAPL